MSALVSIPHSQYQQARHSRDPRFDGRFFVAVRTTGIFCRNICPVKMPKEENVEYFDFAAQAMQAGYRPCLRCRPDSAPGSFAWKGTETTLIRAMKLLKESPSLSMQALCERLGISDRYLRKLFQRYLGIAPKQYQMTEQLLFAKNLLHETQLSVEDVAQSCGFNSSRRLQDNMMKFLRLSPGQVRQQSLTHANGKALCNSLRLSFREPYHWPQVRDFMALRAIEGVEIVTDDGYQRHFTLPVGAESEPVHGTFKAMFNAEERVFDVQIEMNSYRNLGDVIRNIRRVLDLDADSNAIAECMIKAGVPEQTIVQGLRLPGVWSVFEAGVRAILGQQVSVKAAISHLSRLTESCGFEIDGKLYFPTAQHILDNNLDCLKMPGARKQTLHNLAQYMVDKDKQSSTGLHQVDDWLSIKGIGPWTVAYAQMRGQSEPDIWLDTDLVIKKQLQQHDICADFAAPWRSYLTFQLWSMA
ncbi:DNA-3-methyladenine glycosylase 2 family protein [Paraneptunicella aestuarii]|uniref:DNA-3-methyladenine glycosylase 2 family protein n=1 Tax=Paraneptunicella aestuarii TaxID=2831148 RepID=UPI001E5C5322|nr:AlkA N-terminal domain-containing protein [Paraneptunicella aestuarii]UAA39187.1 DNA-3-methyladenine glycosylase 2 family protein [Paraneptunicella aestuarii]